MSLPRYFCGSYTVDNFESITFEEFLASPKSNIIDFDTETTGLDVWKEQVVLVQLNMRGKYSIALDTREFTEYNWTELFKILNAAQLVVGANLAFDYNMCKKYGQVLTTYVYDVIDAEEVLDLGKYTAGDLRKYKQTKGYGHYSLAALVSRYLQREMSKEIRTNFLHKKSERFTSEEINYGLWDVEWLEEVYQKQLARSVSLGFLKMYTIGRRRFTDLTFSSMHSLCLADATYNGAPIRAEMWKDNIPYFKNKAAEAEQKLIRAIKATGANISTGLFGDSINVKWTSSKQVIAFFKKYLGITLVDRFGKPSAGKLILKKLNHPVAKALLEYRVARKSISAFGANFLKLITEAGRIHPNYRRMVSTFRISASKPNLQQIPKDSKFRAPFQAPEGWMLNTADYPQQEPHIGGHKTQDESIKDFYENGDGDIHSFMGSKILSVIRGYEIKLPPKKENDPEAMKIFEACPDKLWRNVGKTLGLAIDYGTSPAGVAANMEIPVDEAKKLMEAVYTAFPKKRKYFDKMFALGLSNGFVYLNEISAIRRYFPEYTEYKKLRANERLTKAGKSKLNMLKGSIERKSINTPTQGTAAMMTKAAAILERDKLIDVGILPLPNAIVQPILVVHDEKVQQIKVPEGEPYKHILKEAMEEAALIFCSYIPMTVKPEYSKSWTH